MTADGEPGEGRVRGHDHPQAAADLRQGHQPGHDPMRAVAVGAWPGRHAEARLKAPPITYARSCLASGAAGARFRPPWPSSSCCSPDAEAEMEAGPPPAAPPPPQVRPGRSGQGAAADRRRAGRRAASEGRRLRPAPLRRPASRRRPGPVRGREDRPSPGRARRPARAQALPGPQRPGLDGERAGPALARLRARLPEVGAPVRRLHRHRRRHAGGRVPPLLIGSAGRRPAERSRGPGRGPALRQPQRRPPALRPG